MKTQSKNKRIGSLVLEDLGFTKMIKYIQDHQGLLASSFVIGRVNEI